MPQGTRDSVGTEPNPRQAKLGVAWRWTLGAVVSLALLVLSLRGVDVFGAWRSATEANLPLLGAALLAIIAATVIKAARWRLMFYPGHRRLHLPAFVACFLVGQAVNAVVPARLGELARAWMIGEKEGVSKAHALWTAAIEKVLDAAALLVCIAILGLWLQLPPWLHQARWTLTAAVVIVLFGCAALLTFRTRALAWVDGLAERVPWVRRGRISMLAHTIVDSLQLMHEPALLGGLVAWSAVAFATQALASWLVGSAMDMSLSFRAALLLLSVLQISAVVPIPTSPGRVGLYHYLCIVTLAIFHVPSQEALAYAVVLHIVTYLPMAIGGPLGLLAMSYGWRDLQAALRTRQ